MDTTETYIKMCDCPEIQGGPKWKQGDFFVWCEDYRLNTLVRNWWIEKGTVDVYELGSWNNSEIVDRVKTIWLPRQDQLQEMVGEEYTFNLLADFRGFYNVRGCDLYPASMSGGNPSMEQLWLAFVMKQKWNKVWDGEKWVKC